MGQLRQHAVRNHRRPRQKIRRPFQTPPPQDGPGVIRGPHRNKFLAKKPPNATESIRQFTADYTSPPQKRCCAVAVSFTHPKPIPDPESSSRSHPYRSTGSVVRLSPVAVGDLLRPVSADRHAAPSPPVPARAIHEQKRTGRTLAGLDIFKIFVADQFGDFHAQWHEQRFGRTPSPRRYQP
jgi:hypothetical protein